MRRMRKVWPRTLVVCLAVLTAVGVALAISERQQAGSIRTLASSLLSMINLNVRGWNSIDDSKRLIVALTPEAAMELLESAHPSRHRQIGVKSQSDTFVFFEVSRNDLLGLLWDLCVFSDCRVNHKASRSRSADARKVALSSFSEHRGRVHGIEKAGADQGPAERSAANREAFSRLYSTARRIGIREMDLAEFEFCRPTKMPTATVSETPALVVQGAVFDDQGSPVKDVGLIALSLDMEDPANRGLFRAHRVITGNRFYVAAHGADRMMLRFEKCGFEPKGVTVERVPKGVSEVNHTQGLRVELSRYRPTVEMVDFRGPPLKYRADDTGVAYTFDRKAGCSPRPSHDANPEVEIWFDSHESAMRHISNGVSLIADVDASGAFPVFPLPWTDEDGWRPAFVPATFRLRMHDPEGGFIPYSPQTDRDRDDLVMGEMEEAPADGYRREWVITADDLKRDLTYFYFKTDGHFGKGSFGLPQVSGDRRCIRLWSLFRMNPTPGERSVATGE